MKTAAIISWTGRGDMDDLATSAAEIMREIGGRRKLKPRRVGSSDLIFSHSDPPRVARLLAHLPGVRSIATGYEFTGVKELEDLLGMLAEHYLKKKSRFSVLTNVEGPGYSVGGITLMANSKILSGRPGSRVSEKAPDARFQITMVDGRGAVGVITRDGVGGTPTSPKRLANCLVSGGMHSAAATWLAVLAGFSIRMVHFQEGEDSLRGVARLYSELSHRMDPRHLSLSLVSGAGGAGALFGAWWKKRAEGSLTLTGLHLECRDSRYWQYLADAPRRMIFPVLFLREEEVAEIQSELGWAATATAATPSSGDSILFGDAQPAPRSWRTYSYGGVRADTNTVLDSLLEKPRERG